MGKKKAKQTQPSVAEYVIQDCPIMGKTIIKHFIEKTCIDKK